METSSKITSQNYALAKYKFKHSTKRVDTDLKQQYYPVECTIYAQRYCYSLLGRNYPRLMSDMGKVYKKVLLKVDVIQIILEKNKT